VPYISPKEICYVEIVQDESADFPNPDLGLPAGQYFVCVIKGGLTEEQKVPWSVRFHVWTNDDSSKTPHLSIAPFSFGEALARVSHFGGAQVFSWGDS